MAIIVASGSTLASRRPTPSGPYYAASALYNAGFRGWPLVVMTAIAGRESNWNPSSSDPGDPAGGSYGLLQINGSHAPGGVATPTWISQMLTAQQNANQAFQLAGGNALTGLGNWALQASPASGTVPLPTATEGRVNGVETPINYSIAPYIAQASAAASEVGVFGPASSDSISNSGAWPGSSGAGAAGPVNQGASCGTRNGGQPYINLPFGTHLLYPCQAKALLGAASLVAGGVAIVLGLGTLVVSGLAGEGPAAPIVAAAAPVASFARGMTRRPARRSSSSGSTAPSRAQLEASPDRRGSASHAAGTRSIEGYSGPRGSGARPVGEPLRFSEPDPQF